MTKKILLTLSIFLLLICLCKYSFAHDVYTIDVVQKIDMTITIKEDGSALISETWNVAGYARNGYVKFLKNTAKEDVLDFKVTDETGRNYEYLENYDQNQGSEQIINKCGVLATVEGTELYWGMETEGEHQYILEYTIKNFIKNFSNDGITKGTGFDFIDEQILINMDLKMVADNYIFTVDNVKFENLEKPDFTVNIDGGAIVLKVNPYYFEGNERIIFSNDAPFEIGKSNTEKENSKKLKKQDILVITLIITFAILYLFGDTIRCIHDYKVVKNRTNKVK